MAHFKEAKPSYHNLIISADKINLMLEAPREIYTYILLVLYYVALTLAFPY